MRKAAFLLLALAVAAPAQADIAPRRNPEPVAKRDLFKGNGRVPGPGIYRDVDDIRDRIDDGRDSGALTRREARHLDRQARGLSWRARLYGRDGLSESEARELQARANYLRDAVSVQRLGGGNKGKGKGRRNRR